MNQRSSIFNKQQRTKYSSVNESSLPIQSNLNIEKYKPSFQNIKVLENVEVLDQNNNKGKI
jgi:hypothetical protein